MAMPAWHERCELRDDVRTGTLELHEFAADLNLVRQKRAPDIYQIPHAFFARTYPSRQLKLLVRQVARRLNDLPEGKPVIRLQVAYGGGKTHTLITLLHLAEQGSALRDDATVQTFLDYADLDSPPRARVALLPFDKFGFEEGLTVYDAEGHSRTVYTPWGALAYQLGGEVGLRKVNDDPTKYTAPAEDRIAELLALPQARDGSSALILIDETLMYCRSTYNAKPSTLGTLKDFFQNLTQAIAHTPKCALVASLISSENEKHDAVGMMVLGELEPIFGRLEENIAPIERDDLPEVLRRRFFAHVPPVEERRGIVNEIMGALQPVPVRDSQKDNEAERRYLEAYPFHPELLDVLYQKWTQLPRFQKTRGALRLMGLALRESVAHDPSPLIAPGVLLSFGHSPAALSPAMAELAAATDAANEWTPILEGEATRARVVQGQFPALRSREIEQAVIATFLHSQPRGKRADAPELLGLLAYADVDPSSLTEGLKAWRGLSWFLVEGDESSWQLDLAPNLNRMHADALDRVTPRAIDDELRARIQRVRELSQTTDGVRTYMMPASPRDVEDSPDFRYLVLGPACAVTPGQPVPASVAAYFTDLTGPDNPRTYRNALVTLAPERARLEGLREQVRRWLAWGIVQRSDDARTLSDVQKARLRTELQGLDGQIPAAIQAAWSVMVAYGEDGAIHAELLKPIPERQNALPFERVVYGLRESERLAPDQIDPDLLLPGSYLNLWRPGQSSMKVADLANAFGQFTRLPRLLRRSVLDKSLVQGVEGGTIVLQMVRSDGSRRTFWRQAPSEDDLRRPELELVLLSAASLASLEPAMLAPGSLPGLWPDVPSPVLTTAQVRGYFDGRRAPRIEGSEVLDLAVRGAAKDGTIMVQVHPDAYWRESLPAELALTSAMLLPPPPTLRPADLSALAIPSAWHDGRTTVGDLIEALAFKQGQSILWPSVRDALIEGNRQGTFSVDAAEVLAATPSERTHIEVKAPEVVTLDTSAFIDTSIASMWQRGQPRLREVKEAIERARGYTVSNSVFLKAARDAAAEGKITLPANAGSMSDAQLLDARVQPKQARVAAEAKLSLRALSDLPQAATQLAQIAPEMTFEFVISISGEGDTLTPAQIERLNDVLTQLNPRLRLT